MMRRSLGYFAAAAAGRGDSNGGGNSDESEEEPYDVVVIGGGSSGILTACRLANSNLRTLLVEQGPNIVKAPSWHYTMPAAKIFHKIHGRYESTTDVTTPQRCFSGWTPNETRNSTTTLAEAAKEEQKEGGRGGAALTAAASNSNESGEEVSGGRGVVELGEKRTFQLPTPQVLGGSSIMGSKTWIRATKRDIELLGTAVEEDTLNGYFRKLENVDQEDNPHAVGYRGAHGRLFQTRPNTANPLYKPFSESVSNQHYAHVADLNKPDGLLLEGTGRPESMTNPFNFRAANVITNVLESCIKTKRPLDIWCNTTVTSLEGDGGNTVRTVEMSFKETGATSSIKATSVVVCAGAIGAARLLTHPDTVKGLSQEAQALPIGHNYWAVPQVVLDYPITTKDSLQGWLASPLAQRCEECNTWLHKRSVGAGGYDDMLLHMRCPRKVYNADGMTPESKAKQQLWAKTVFRPYRVLPHAASTKHRKEGQSVPNSHGFQMAVNLMTPASRGTVGWSKEEDDEEGEPSKLLINPNYFSDPIDQEALADATSFASNLCRESRSLSAAIDWPAAEASEPVFQPTSISGGTVSMDTCLDLENFTLKGTSNVFVAGSAVLPHPTEGDSIPLSLAVTEMINDRMLRL